MKVVSVSDLHIHNDDRVRAMRTLCSTIRELAPDALVLNGDIADPFITPWEQILGTESWRLLWSLVWYLIRDGAIVYWVNRNHDYTGKEDYLPGAITVDRVVLDNIEYRHGYEFDMTWGGVSLWPGVSRVVFWLADHFPGLCIKFWNVFRKRGSPAKRKWEGYDQTPWGDWHWQVGWIHLQAMNYAVKQRCKLVIGHTHCPGIYGGILADDGDMVDSFSYLIVQDGEFSINHL